MLENCERVLSGPVGPLTFRLRSEDEDGSTEVPEQLESNVIPNSLTLSSSVDALLDDMLVGDSDNLEIQINSVLVNDMLDGRCSNILPSSPGGSETRSVSLSLVSQFQQLGQSGNDRTEPSGNTPPR